MHVVSAHFSEAAECVIFDRDRLPVLRRQVVVEVFRMEGIVANNTAAACAVQNNCVWPIPRWVSYSLRSFSIQSDVGLIGFPANSVAANEKTSDQHSQDESPALCSIHAGIVRQHVNCCKQAVTLRIPVPGILSAIEILRQLSLDDGSQPYNRRMQTRGQYVPL